MATKSNRIEKEGLRAILILAMILLLCMMLMTGAEIEFAAGKSNDKGIVKGRDFESVPGGLPKGMRKPESGCHRPGFPVPPGTHCPAPPHRHRPRPVLNG